MTIDWAALHSAFQMNMPEVRCFLAIDSGRVLKLPPGDPQLAVVRSDLQAYLPIEAIPSRIQYQWVAEYIESITHLEVRERLEAAINGKGAFRRFKDILLTLPEERRRWFEYRDQRMRQRIVEWVAEVGIEPLNEAPWTQEGHDYTPEHATDGSSEQEPMPGMGGAVGTPPLPTRPAKASSPPSQRHDIEALHDFFVEWSDGRAPEAWQNPLRLDELADEVDRRFFIKARNS